MNLEDKIENVVNEKPNLFRRGINFLKRKSLPVLLATTIGIGSTYALTSCGKSKKSYIPTGPAAEFVEPDSSKIVQDSETGMFMVKDELTLSFVDGTTDPEKQEIINGVNGQTLAVDTDLNEYQIKVSANTTSDLYQIENQLELNPKVNFVSPCYFLDEDRVPNDTYTDTWDETNPSGNNWAWEYIKAPSAWDNTTGNSNTKIGVVDFGFDKDHNDLKNNIAKAEGAWWSLNPNNNHGTIVAGIIGAEGNNSYGITGMNWNTSLYLYRTTGSDYSVKMFIKKAVKDGARIINFSGGINWRNIGRTPSDTNSKDIKIINEETQTYRNLLKFLNQNNVLLIKASGNDGIDAKWSGIITPILASEFPDNYILVAANDSGGQLPHWSNHGSLVTVSAPGTNIYTLIKDNQDGIDNDHTSIGISGTSVAAPFVTGLTGLLLSVDNTLTPAQIKQAIVAGAQKGGKFFTDPDGNNIYIVNSLESILEIADEWGLPMNVSNNSGSSHTPSIAVDSNNGLHVVWRDNTNTISSTSQIFYSKYNGSSWSSPMNVSNNSGSSYTPSIAVDSNNGLHVVWRDSTLDEIFYSKYNGSSWSSPMNVSNNSRNSRSPSIAVDSLNNSHVVWDNDVHSDYEIQKEIFYSKYNGSSWSSPMNVSNGRSSSYPAINSIGPSIAVDSNNNVHVVWHHNVWQSATLDEIFYSKYNGSSWSSPMNISNDNGQSYEARIAVDSLNNLHVVWGGDSTIGSRDILYSKYNGSSWSSPMNVSNNSRNSRSPSIAVDSLNNSHVVWYEDISNTSCNFEIFYSKYNGSSWSSPMNVSNSAGGNPIMSPCPSIAVDSNNGLHVVWDKDTPSGNYEILYKKKQQ